MLSYNIFLSSYTCAVHRRDVEMKKKQTVLTSGIALCMSALLSRIASQVLHTGNIFGRVDGAY